MNDLPEALETLMSRVDALEKRVHILEHPAEGPVVFVTQSTASQPAERAVEDAAIEQAGSVAPVLGKAMLGIAGAYVLRAVAESNAMPRQQIAAIAIAYAFAWLVGAARTKTTAAFVHAIYAGASALILAPMLWELTLSFHVLSAALAAAVLGGYVALAAGLTWKGGPAPVFWVAHAAASVAAIALSIATHDFIPFFAALLLMVLLCELGAARHQAQAIRTLVAAVADAAMGILIFVYNSPQNAHAEYPVLGTAMLVGPACLLFVLYAGSVAVQTVLLKRQITVFETLECITAFVLASCSVLFFAPANGGLMLGVACLAFCVVTYTGAFALFRRETELRNFRVFAFWSAALFVSGAWLSLPAEWAAASLGVAALVAMVVGVRQQCMTLDFHGVVYLAAAAVASGLLQYTFNALAGSVPGKPGWGILLFSAAAVLCYAASKERQGEDWQHQFLHFVPAFLAACAVATLVAGELLQLAASFITPDAVHVAFIRSITVCAIALALAFGGARWKRLEMTRIAYAALAFEAAKLIFEDLRLGRMEFIAASIFLFAVTLIGVPRVARMGPRT